MYELSAVMAKIYAWCLSRVERSPRWHGLAISAVASLGLLLVLFVAPTWVFAAFFVVVIGPVQVYMFAHAKVWQTRDKIKKDQFAQTMKTHKLLKGTRFDT